MDLQHKWNHEIEYERNAQPKVNENLSNATNQICFLRKYNHRMVRTLWKFDISKQNTQTFKSKQNTQAFESKQNTHGFNETVLPKTLDSRPKSNGLESHHHYCRVKECGY